MSRYIAIDWDSQGLHLVAGATKGGKATVERMLHLAEPLCVGPAEAQAAGQRLKEQLKKAGIAAAPTLVCIGRERAVFRDIHYPDVPAQDAPDIIHFQTLKELTFAAEDAVIDYQLVSIPWPTGEQRALAVVVRKEVVAAVKKFCQAAGLKLEGLSLRPFGVAANLLAQNENETNPGETVGAVVLGATSAELCVTRGRELLFTRSLSLNGGGLNALIPELKRSLAAYAGQFPAHAVQRLFAAGLQNEVEIEHLSVGSRLPVFPYVISSAAPVEPAAVPAYAGALGLIQERAAGQPALNLMDPKQAAPPSRKKQFYIAAGVAAAVLLLLGCGVAFAITDSSRLSQIKELQAKKNDLKKQIETYADTEKRLDAINAWAGTEMVMLDELHNIIALFPDQPGVRITKLEWKTLASAPATTQAAKPVLAKPAAPAAQQNTSKPIGELIIEASSESADAFKKLKESLESDGHWIMRKWEKDVPGPNQVRCTIHVHRQAPHEYRTVLGKSENTTAPAGGGDRGRGNSNRLRPPAARPTEGGRP